MITSPYEKPPFLPPRVHPRLMLTENDLPRLRENLERKENALAVSVWKELLVRPVTGEGATPAYGTYDLAEILSLESLAFRALLTGSEEDTKKAVDTADLLLSRFEVRNGNMGARWGGHLIFTVSEVYDWCYSSLSPEKKNAWIERCEEIAAAYFEMGYPPQKQGPIVGHGTEAQLLRDLLAFSIAVYDERPDVYSFCAGRIFSEYAGQIPEYLRAGAHTQGPSYGSYRYTWLAWSELILSAFCPSPVYGDTSKTAEWFLSMTRPDGEDLRLGDDFNELKALYNRRAPFTVPFFFAYALTGRKDFYDEFSRGFCREFLLPEKHGMDYYDEGSWGEGCLSPVSMIVFDRKNGFRKEADTPVCRYFGSPVGETVFKKGDTYIFMKIGEYWGANHDHLDTGCFQLYEGAPLLTDSGIYDSYSTPHRRQYLVRTSAHNCLTVETPEKDMHGEYSEEILYDGGTRRPNRGKEPKKLDEFLSDTFRMATVLSHRESDGGCELTGDLSPAYVHSCSSVVRKMTYAHATKTFTLEDTVVSKDKNSVKTEHLHMQTEPKIDGNRVFIENGGHTAVVEILSPAAFCIEAIGGEGHAYEVGGVNFPPNPPYENAELGWGQVKIIATEMTEKTVFKLRITLS